MRLRRATPGDAAAVAAVHVRSWQAAYRGLLPDDVLDGLDPAAFAARYTFGRGGPDDPVTVVAEMEGSVAGFATTGPDREGETDRGELWALYADPAWWGHGVGRRLVGDARRRLRRSGRRRAVLWVLDGNARAERFYRADGWRPDGRRRTEVVHGVRVDERCLRRDL